VLTELAWGSDIVHIHEMSISLELQEGTDVGESLSVSRLTKSRNNGRNKLKLSLYTSLRRRKGIAPLILYLGKYIGMSGQLHDPAALIS
jgi:hypothetical protein